ncbi:MAG: tetratricopeptide repeat protein [Candidatus Eisenbacteria bacterium]
MLRWKEMILSATLALVLTAAPVSASVPAPEAGDAYTSQEALSRYLLGRLLEEQGDRGEALNQFYRAMVLDPRAGGIARRVSELKLARGESESALEFADKALAADPRDARASWLRGAALLNLERVGDALAPLQNAVALDSERVEYWRTLALAADHVENWRLSADAWRHAAWLDEEDGESWFQLAASLARLGRFGGADSAAQRAAELNTMRPGLLFLQGWIAENLGRNHEAAEFYRHQIALQSDDETVQRRLIAVLVRDERWSEALDEVRPLAAAHPDDLDLRHLELDLCFRAGRKSEGMRGIEALRRTDPNSPEALAVRVDVLARHGQAATAAGEAETWSAAHPNDVRGWLLAAFAREKQGRLDDAERHLEHAVQVAPDSVDVYYTIGRFYRDHGRDHDAERVYLDATRRFPGEDGLWFNLAATRERLGDLPGAEAAVRDVLGREPDNPGALNFLGYMWADHGLRLDEAVEMVQRALTADPDNGAYLDSLGWAYFRLGRLDEARPLLERAVALTRGDPVVREHLGDVYKSLKLNALARDQYRLALATDTGNARLKGKLEELR